jgi:hypothetical protein
MTTLPAFKNGIIYRQSGFEELQPCPDYRAAQAQSTQST